MIDLFHIPNHTIDTSKWTHALHDKGVEEFEARVAEYVGAKYACGVNSATNAITLILKKEGFANITQANTATPPEFYPRQITIPSVIPPVVCNAIYATECCSIRFKDDIDWVGDSYVLHEFDDYKVIDSAQKIEKGQFIKEANSEDVMLFSFYPTKPIGSLDGGMIVTDDKEKYEWYKMMVMNGMSYAHDNWERKIIRPGYKMYLSSVQAEIASKNMDNYLTKRVTLELVRNEYNKAFSLENTSEHLYRVEVADNKDTQAALKAQGITTGIHYAAMHESEAYHAQGGSEISSNHARKTLSLPYHEMLQPSDVKKVIEAMKPYLCD